jgi:hypothetical protein
MVMTICSVFLTKTHHPSPEYSQIGGGIQVHVRVPVANHRDPVHIGLSPLQLFAVRLNAGATGDRTSHRRAGIQIASKCDANRPWKIFK